MFDFSLHEMNQKLWDVMRKCDADDRQMPKSLPEELAAGIARDILNAMPEDSDMAEFVSLAMSEIANKLAAEAEKMSAKIPTAQELLAFTGEYNENEARGVLGGMRGLLGSKPSKKEVIEKLANSRYDLSDFANITFSEEDEGVVEEIVIATAHKGKILHLVIRSYDSDIDDETRSKILKKCTMH